MVVIEFETVEVNLSYQFAIKNFENDHQSNK